MSKNYLEVINGVKVEEKEEAKPLGKKPFHSYAQRRNRNGGFIDILLIC